MILWRVRLSIIWVCLCAIRPISHFCNGQLLIVRLQVEAQVLLSSALWVWIWALKIQACVRPRPQRLTWCIFFLTFVGRDILITYEPRRPRKVLLFVFQSLSVISGCLFTYSGTLFIGNGSERTEIMQFRFWNHSHKDLRGRVRLKKFRGTKCIWRPLEVH